METITWINRIMKSLHPGNSNNTSQAAGQFPIRHGQAQCKLACAETLGLLRRQGPSPESLFPSRPPLFGQATAGEPNGEGFYETANNRWLEMQIRFTI
jgi:hypothetical protein